MRREQRLIRVVAVLVAAVLVLSGAVSYLYLDQRDQTETAVTGERQAEDVARSIAQPAEESAKDVLAACRSADADQLAELGISCDEAKETKDAIDDADTPAPPRDGTDGAAATIGQVLAATSRLLPDTLAAYCAERNECTPPAPADGEDGASATQEQVDAAVTRLGPAILAAFCAANGDCRGPRGPAGESTDGKDGTNGTDGENAPAVTSISCNGTTGRFAFDDGSTIDVADMCAPPLIPGPEPTE